MRYMKPFFYFFFYLCFSSSLLASVTTLDKTVAILGEKIISLTEIKRLLKTQQMRHEIAPFIYPKETMTQQKARDVMIEVLLVRKGLARLGIELADSDVESQIKANEERLKLSKSRLTAILAERGIQYSEYFELIREGMERNVLQSQVISPSVSVSEQEIKNYYIKKGNKSETLSYRYDLKNFLFSKEAIKKLSSKEMHTMVQEHLKHGQNPLHRSLYEVIPLQDIPQEDLLKTFRQELEERNEGELTSAIKHEGDIYFFYVVKKELKESAHFMREKERYGQELFIAELQKITASWIEKEKKRHYLYLAPLK